MKKYHHTIGLMPVFILVFCLMLSLSAFAAPYDKASGEFPFEIELDTQSCERLCYAGHPSSGVSYVKGYAVSPQTALSISVASGADTTVSMDDLSMEISLIYENESNTASAEETVRAYEEGDLEPGAWYPLFEETNIDNLAERDRLYSGSLSSIKVELEYKGMRNERSDKTVYLQVCSQEELNDLEAVVNRVERAFPYPVFVKPSNAGSSRGVTRADSREMLREGLLEAARHDRRILVEEMIVGHEIECAVFGGGAKPVRSSGVGEILAAAEFYDFDAKYYNGDSRTVVDPALPEGAAEEVRRAAEQIFRAVDGYGLARVDFFVKEDGTVVFNEINTMPGFTAISMYPMLWEARGISKKQLVNDLIAHALLRYER